MSEQEKWGNVNLGVDVLQGHGEQNQPGKADFQKTHPHSKGKQQYNPGRNQELNLGPEHFKMHKKDPHNETASIHLRIKELLGEGMERNLAVAKAKSESKGTHGDVGTINQKEVYRSKYQAEEPSKRISPFSEQIQGTPFM